MQAHKTKIIACFMAAMLVCAFGVACPSVAMAALPEPHQSMQVMSLFKISKHEASRIALNHAGLTKKQVRQLSVTNAKRKDQPAYLVKFRRGKVQFTYSIGKYTGAIISYSASKIK